MELVQLPKVAGLLEIGALKNITQCLVHKKYPVNVRSHSCKGQGRQAFLTAAASNGFENKTEQN